MIFFRSFVKFLSILEVTLKNRALGHISEKFYLKNVWNNFFIKTSLMQLETKVRFHFFLVLDFLKIKNVFFYFFA